MTVWETAEQADAATAAISELNDEFVPNMVVVQSILTGEMTMAAAVPRVAL